MNRARPSVRLAAALAMLLAASGSGAPAAAATSSRAGGASVAPGDSIAARMKGVTRRDGLLGSREVVDGALHRIQQRGRDEARSFRLAQDRLRDFLARETLLQLRAVEARE